MEKYSDLNIEVKELKENDVVVIYFPEEKYNIDTICDMFYDIRDYFPKHKCLALPMNCKLEFQVKEDIIKCLNE